MDKTAGKIAKAIESEDAQGLSELLNNLPIPARKNGGRRMRGTGMVYAHHCHAFITTRIWPAQTWSGKETHEFRGQLKDRTGREAQLIQSSADFIYALVNRAPSVVFDIPQISSHPVWRHFRSLSSEGKNSILHVLTRQSQCPQWIDKILDTHGEYLFKKMENNRNSCWVGCVQWPFEVATAGLEVFRKHGWLDLNKDEDLAIVMKHASLNGRLAIVEWAQDITKCPRMPGVEVELMKHRRLNGRERSLCVGMAWTSLNQRWGPAPDNVVRDVWKILIKHHRVPEGKKISDTLALVEEEMNDRNLWSSSAQSFLLDTAVQHFNTEVLVEYTQRGWKFDENEMAEHASGLQKASKGLSKWGNMKNQDKINNLISFINRERLLSGPINMATRSVPTKPSL